MSDPSCGYDAVAEAFAAARSDAGVAVVRAWAARLPRGGAVLDVGAGTGAPLTVALLSAGLDVAAIDPAPAMATRFRAQLPGIPIACERAQDSAFFARRFDGVLMVGVVFLLGEEAQAPLLACLARALRPGGALLFSAPREVGGWTDALTGLPSVSLGHAGYTAALRAAGLTLAATHTDEGGNHYYEAQRPV